VSGPAGDRARRLLAQARLAQALTVGWMAVEGSVAVAAGAAAHSVALTGFGLDSAVELVSSAVVLRRLLQRSPEVERGSLDAGERRAAAVVGWALRTLIAYLVLAAAASLLLGVRAEASPAGLALAAAAIPIMAVLWRWRLRLADRLGSPAMRGDAACSAVCLYLAATTLVGLALSAAFGWWWADSLAGLALVWWVRGEASEALEAAREPEPQARPARFSSK
jgi:divalent metal cation (Fe/Co/Zn/Cd) transporter